MWIRERSVLCMLWFGKLESLGLGMIFVNGVCCGLMIGVVVLVVNWFIILVLIVVSSLLLLILVGLRVRIW